MASVVYLTWRYTTAKTEFEFSSDAFRLRSPAAYSAGEEVMISYGLLGRRFHSSTFRLNLGRFCH